MSLNFPLLILNIPTLVIEQKNNNCDTNDISVISAISYIFSYFIASLIIEVKFGLTDETLQLLLLWLIVDSPEQYGFFVVNFFSFL